MCLILLKHKIVRTEFAFVSLQNDRSGKVYEADSNPTASGQGPQGWTARRTQTGLPCPPAGHIRSVKGQTET